MRIHYENIMSQVIHSLQLRPILGVAQGFGAEGLNPKEGWT
jgi:hypothetical protein